MQNPAAPHFENGVDDDDDRHRRVSYIYDPNIGNNNYGTDRIHKAHSYILQTHIDHLLEINRPNLADVSDFTKFHSPEYIEFLRSVTLETLNDPSIYSNLQRFNIAPNRVFHGLFEYCRAYAGGTITAAAKLNRREADIAINWFGGMNLARRDQASGSCYVNDVVLGILELLKTFKRVLYIDIGLLHGDAVEKAFYDTDRVMTVSFHKIGKSGDIRDVGVGRGKYYSLNAPLKPGLDDTSFRTLFKPTIYKAVEIYQPEVIVLQSGADSLAPKDDTIDAFNLSIVGHGRCLLYIRSLNVPLMVLGGGGSLEDVAYCWTFETAIAQGTSELDGNLMELLSRYNLDDNLNTVNEIEVIRNRLLLQLSQVMHVPIREATEAVEMDTDHESESDEEWHFLG